MSRDTLALYLRLSAGDRDLTPKGKTESNSIANQRNLLTDYIHRHPDLAGAELLEFCDDGWSGKNFDRPAVQDLLQRVKQGEIQCILVKDLSRFGRDYLTVGQYLTRIFPFLGVRFIAVNDGFDSSQPTEIDSLSTSFQTLLNDLYSREVSRKVREAKRFRAQRGDFLSPFAPYGYQKDPRRPNRLLIDPAAAPTVRLIFQLMAAGQSATEIARLLNAQCVPTPMLHKRALGCPRRWSSSVQPENFWTSHTVTAILRDARYTGKTIYGKRTRKQVGAAATVPVPPSDWITAAHTHEAIVTPETFASVQARLRTYAARDRNSPGKFPLYQKVRCGVCGYRMERIQAKEPYYLCRTSRLTPAYPCTETRHRERDLMDAVLTALQTQARSTVDGRRLWEEQRRQSEQRAALARQTVAGLRQTLPHIDQAQNILYERFALGELDRASYQAAKKAAMQKRDDAIAQIKALEAQLQTSEREPGRPTPQQTAGDTVPITALVPHVLQELVIGPAHTLHIIWNFADSGKQLLRNPAPAPLPPDSRAES